MPRYSYDNLHHLHPERMQAIDDLFYLRRDGVLEALPNAGERVFREDLRGNVTYHVTHDPSTLDVEGVLEELTVAQYELVLLTDLHVACAYDCFEQWAHEERAPVPKADPFAGSSVELTDDDLPF